MKTVNKIALLWEELENLLNKPKPSYREIRPMRGRLMRGLRVQDRSYFILTTRDTMQNSQVSRVYVIIIHKQQQWYITDKHFLSLSPENPIFIYEFHQWHDEISLFLKKWLFCQNLALNIFLLEKFNYHCTIQFILLLSDWQRCITRLRFPINPQAT